MNADEKKKFLLVHSKIVKELNKLGEAGTDFKKAAPVMDKLIALVAEQKAHIEKCLEKLSKADAPKTKKSKKSK